MNENGRGGAKWQCLAQHLDVSFLRGPKPDFGFHVGFFLEPTARGTLKR